MLTKLLLTLLVIIGCYWLLQLQRRSATPRAQTPAPGSRRGRWLLLALLGVALTLGITLWLLDWQDQRVRLAVEVINPSTGETRHYEVYRSALQGRRFTTVDGLEVQLGAAERVEIRELPEP